MDVVLPRLLALLPRRCPGCHGQLGAAQGLCSTCAAQLRPQVQRHSPLSEVATPHLVVLGPYRGVLGRSVRALKYGGARELAPLLGAKLAQGVPHWWGVQAVSAVPLHPRRLQERGFNQSELLARAAAGALGVPYLETLRRIRYDGAQAKRGAAERAELLSGAFAPHGSVPPPGPLLLIDDVTTTGRTLLACAGVLRSAGVPQLYFAAVAR